MKAQSISVRPFILAFALLVCVAGPALATNYYLNADQPSGKDWNDKTFWALNADGTGGSPTTIAGNDYFINGHTLRTPDTSGTTQTFVGNSLTLNGGTFSLKLNQLNFNAVVTTFNTTGVGGSIVQASAYTNNNLNITTYNNNANTTFTAGAGRGYSVSATTLTGNGNFQFINTGTYRLSVGTGTAFTGNVTIGSTAATLDFQNDLVLGGNLLISSAAIIRLDQNVSFAGLTINGDVFAGGTYSHDTLSNTYGTTMFPTVGTPGSITVLPEPMATTIIAVILTLAGLRHRSPRNA